jgi:hypothetical protein
MDVCCESVPLRVHACGCILTAFAFMEQALQFVGSNSGKFSRENMKHRHSVGWQWQAQVCHDSPSSLSSGFSSRASTDHIRSPAVTFSLFLSHLLLYSFHSVQCVCLVSDRHPSDYLGRQWDGEGGRYVLGLYLVNFQTNQYIDNLYIFKVHNM